MRPRSPAPPRRAGAAPGQGRAGWVGTGPASPPRRQFRPLRAPCTPAAPPWLLRCLLLRALLPSARFLTSLASAHRFPGLLTYRSFSPPPRPSHLLGLRCSCCHRERAVTPWGRAAPRAGGAGPGGGGAARAVCCPARALRRARVPQGQIRCFCEPLAAAFHPRPPPSRRHCYLRVPKDWFL